MAGVLHLALITAAVVAHGSASASSSAFLPPRDEVGSPPPDSSQSDGEILQAFARFQVDFGKQYTDADWKVRFEAFRSNLHIIRKENMKNHSYTLRLNTHSDITLKALVGDGLESNSSDNLGFGEAIAPQDSAWAASAEESPLLESSMMSSVVDWRTKGAITPVLDQGMSLGGGSSGCGSCWAFAAVGAISAAYQRATGNLVLLSEQQFVDCTPGTCKDGGITGDAMEFAFSHDLCTRQSYPYRGVDAEACIASKCSVALPLGSVSKVAAVPFTRDSDEGNELALKRRLSIQPAAVSLWASKAFQNYGEGVFSGPCDGTESSNVNHAVLFVGYGTVGGQTYWLVKNSWGLGWGESGYMKLARAAGTKGLGMCNSYSRASYPVMSVSIDTPPPSPATPPPSPATPPPSSPACCSKCSGGFCSPKSGNCHAAKTKDYYAQCPATPAPPATPGCCNKCPGRFCSLVSGNCHAAKTKDYYAQCPAMPSKPSCCGGCAGGFCSPRSGTCYGWKSKDYYQTCPIIASCCSNVCSGQFCSPRSGHCHGSKAKDYYKSCP